MDRLLYVAMTGAAQTMAAQASVAHNLANASTTGFKAEMAAFQSIPVEGPGNPTRINAMSQGLGADFSPGAETSTGRDLDIAVRGQGWIAVQSPDGSEGYTRAGDLRIDADGLLTTAAGLPVLGDGGPVTLPPYSKLDIGSDGSIALVPLGQGPTTVSSAGRIKLVNPDPAALERSADGLMHLRDGAAADTDDSVQVAAGTLEASNVNPSESLVRMIELSRQFEMQMQSIKNVDQNAQSATRLLQATS
ncbi:MAG: flagellar basal-body rod protein FlgF [Dokdonella sp.]